MELSRAATAPGTRIRRRIDPVNGLLIASRCLHCGLQSWPGRAICPRCGQDAMEDVPLPQTGILQSYTVVWVPRPRVATPYTLGQVDFGAGALLFGQVRALSANARTPLRVRVVIPPDGDEDALSFWFEPDEA